MGYEFKDTKTSVKFITSAVSGREKALPIARSISKERTEAGRNFESVCTPLKQSWIIDYPLLAYKSFKPDNNEILIGNFANRNK